MITIVDYGLGNVQAFQYAYRRLGVPVHAARTAQELQGAERVVLPGVGSFDWAMERLQASGMRPALDRLALESKVPILGVCVGMQMMAVGSEEGTMPGLGWLPAHVRRLPITSGQQDVFLPHMGWNDVAPAGPSSPLLHGLGPQRGFYFLHSYYFAPQRSVDVAGTTEYGIPFCSVVHAGNLHGVQFHPEKSHRGGLDLLKNFAEA